MRRQMKLNDKNKRTGILLCIPALLVIAFAIYSLGYALVMSFNTNKGVLQGEFNFQGLDNYIKAFRNKELRQVIFNTVSYAFMTILVELGIGLLVSAALRRELKGSKFVKLCIIFPMMIAPIASGTIWRWMFADRYGVINYLLGLLGAEGPIWLSQKLWAKAAVLIVSVWTAAPFVILVLMAAINAVSREVIEAAKIDGASELQVYWNVIFPYLRSSVTMILLIRIPDALKMYDIVYIMTGGGPSNSTQVISYYIYTKGFTSFKFAEASATAFLLFLIIALFSVIFTKLVNRKAAQEVGG